MWILISVIFSIFLYSDGSDSTNFKFDYNPELFEGNECPLKDHVELGICLKASQCPERLYQIQSGLYHGEERCGFDNFDEIVCCPTSEWRSMRPKTKIRPARQDQNLSESTNISFDRPELFEGNQCPLKNGVEKGVCVKASHCPEIIQQIQAGVYTGEDRCGFDNFDEIVCCPNTERRYMRPKTKIRRARQDRNLSESTNISFDRPELFEGNQCPLKNGVEKGVCVKASHCPEIIQQIQAGVYTGEDRCGFDNFDEIVCCPNTERRSMRSKTKIRPAEAVCQKLGKMLEEINRYKKTVLTAYNGVTASEREFPHMAALGYPVSRHEAAGGVKYACGGTLISEKHVLTAAHCVNNIPNEVVLGTNDLDNINAAGVQRIPISRIIKHPKYKRGISYHDVAILELKDPVEFTFAVHPTCLMTKPPTKDNTNGHNSLVTLGWGITDLDGTTSTKLIKAENVKFVNNKNCGKRYANGRANFIPRGLSRRMICVMDPDTRRTEDTCWSTSGGPLLIKSNQFSRVIGVTSFGHACGGAKPGVYTSVYKYLDWIENQVWRNAD